MIALTLEQVRALKPCERRMAAISRMLEDGRAYTAAEAVTAGVTWDDLVWVASELARVDKDVERRLRHWMADCAEHALHIYKREYPDDMRPRDAIKARCAAWEDEEKWQLERLIYWMGDLK